MFLSVASVADPDGTSCCNAKEQTTPFSPTVDGEKNAALPYSAILRETGGDCQRENRDGAKKSAKK